MVVESRTQKALESSTQESLLQQSILARLMNTTTTAKSEQMHQTLPSLASAKVKHQMEGGTEIWSKISRSCTSIKPIKNGA